MKTRRLRSLFWRIFLSLWLGSTVLMVGSSLLMAVIAEREVPDQVRGRVGTLLRGNAHHLLQLYTRVSSREFAEAVATSERDYDLAVYFVDESGRDILGRPLPASLQELQRTLSAGGVKLNEGGPLRGGALSFSDRMRAPDGREFLVLGSATGPPLPSIDLSSAPCSRRCCSRCCSQVSSARCRRGIWWCRSTTFAAPLGSSPRAIWNRGSARRCANAPTSSARSRRISTAWPPVSAN
jgi:hypothetical protein